MAINPTALTPRTGAGLPVTGGAAPSLLRPSSNNLIAGSLPAAQTYTGSTYTSSLINDHFRRQDALSLEGGRGHNALIGDSNTAAFPTSLLPFSENYGVSGDTLEGLITRLRAGNYASLAYARSIIWFAPGFNNIASGTSVATTESLIAAILSYFTGPLVIVPCLPTDNTTWNGNYFTVETWLKSTYAARSNCQIVDVSSFRDGSNNSLSGVTRDGQHWTGTTQITLAQKVIDKLRLV